MSRPASKVPAPHSHDGYEETIYGLEGLLTWTIEGAPIDVGPGEAICIPRGAVHGFDNTGDVDAVALAIVTPGMLGPDYFREVGAVLDASAGGPPDLEAVGAVMRRHGLTPASPSSGAANALDDRPLSAAVAEAGRSFGGPRATSAFWSRATRSRSSRDGAHRVSR